MEIVGGKIKGTPKVSVICITYNQKNYIKQALESMLMQKTNFDYEIIVHDDASTDGTADIVRDFAEKNSNKVTALLQNENQYQKNVKLSTFTEPRVKGEYVAFCEGDDFWVSDRKLQFQYDIMQKHPECSMCVHKVQGVSEDGKEKLRQFPRIKVESGVCEAEKVMHWMLADNEWVFHTTSYFVRSKIWREDKINPPMYVKYSVFGDEGLMRYCAANGDFFYIDEIMSCYRINALGSTLDDVRRKKYNVDLHKKRLEVFKYFDDETSGRFHEDITVAIERETIGLLRAEKRYKELLKDKKLYNKLSQKAKLQVLVSAYIPWFDNIYYGIRKMIIGY